MSNFEKQADELSKYFSLIWVPQSGFTGSYYSMGYDPLYYFDHKSAFGNEAELRSMIRTLKSKGTGVTTYTQIALPKPHCNHEPKIYDQYIRKKASKHNTIR